MSNTKRKSFRPAHERLKSNPKVSASVVEQYQKLESELHRLGVDTRTRYTLLHPFDWMGFQRLSKNNAGKSQPGSGQLEVKL